MKKILTILFILLSFSFVSALKVNTFDSQSFRINQWSVSIYPITISVDSNAEINKKNWINLVIQPTVDFRFDANSILNLVVTGTAKNKIDFKNINVNPNLLTIHIPVISDFQAWDVIEISGLNIIAYSRPTWYQYIWIDVNWDSVSDYTPMNGIRVLDLAWYQDITSPNEVFNLTGYISGNMITLNWINPGDIDFQLTKISLLDSSKSTIKETYKYNETGDSQILGSDVKYIKFQTVDYRSNSSTWVIYSVNDLNNLTFATPVITGTWSTQISTWSNTTSDTITQTQTNNEGKLNTGNIVTTNLVSKYIPDFTTPYLIVFVNKFDSKIEKLIESFSIDKKNNVTIIRNDIVKLLDSYDNGEISYINTVSQLRDLVISFSNAVRF